MGVNFSGPETPKLQACKAAFQEWHIDQVAAKWATVAAKKRAGTFKSNIITRAGYFDVFAGLSAAPATQVASKSELDACKFLSLPMWMFNAFDINNPANFTYAQPEAHIISTGAQAAGTPGGQGPRVDSAALRRGVSAAQSPAHLSSPNGHAPTAGPGRRISAAPGSGATVTTPPAAVLPGAGRRTAPRPARHRSDHRSPHRAATTALAAQSYYDGSPVCEDGDLYGSGLGVARVDMMHLFTALCMFCQGPLLVRTRVCFQLFDDDFNGTMDKAEMRVFLSSATRTLHVLDLYPVLPKPADIRKLADMMFSQADSDGDGCVSPDEFYQWARRRTAPTQPLMQRFRKARGVWLLCSCSSLSPRAPLNAATACRFEAGSADDCGAGEAQARVRGLVRDQRGGRPRVSAARCSTPCCLAVLRLTGVAAMCSYGWDATPKHVLSRQRQGQRLGAALANTVIMAKKAAASARKELGPLTERLR